MNQMHEWIETVFFKTLQKKKKKKKRKNDWNVIEMLTHKMIKMKSENKVILCHKWRNTLDTLMNDVIISLSIWVHIVILFIYLKGIMKILLVC